MGSPKVEEFLKRNREYVASGAHPPRPKFWDAIPSIRAERRGTTVIACCDPRLDVKRILGVDDEPREPVWILQNAGGRAQFLIDQIASVQAVSNPGTILVLHHNDCGMSHVHDADVRKKLLEIAPHDKENIEATEFGEIVSPIDDTIKHDVDLLRNSSWIQKDVNIFGLKFDFDTGLLEQVV